MKFKSFLLGASLALCGAAFGQDGSVTQVYVVNANITLQSSNVSVTEDDNQTTTITFGADITSTPGNSGGANRPYLGNPVYVQGEWGPHSTIICYYAPVECVWIKKASPFNPPQ
jgi:hypothetical protein